jgi:hypothetical protein
VTPGTETPTTANPPLLPEPLFNDAPARSRPTNPISSRIAYAAAHVVPRTLAENVPGAPADINWDETLAFRHHLWSWGLGVADAMDTAQRNMGLDWTATRQLIRRSAAEAESVAGALVVGVSTDHVLDEHLPLDRIVDAYREQLDFVEDSGAGVVLMASRHLARAARGADDYRRVYEAVLARASRAVFLHWLGSAFDPNLTGYWGAPHPHQAEDTVGRIIRDAGPLVVGIKMSTLDPDAEIRVRTALPDGVRMFTGDDYNYVRLIEGDEHGHSHALLGAFAAIAPTASMSLQALDRGDVADYRALLAPTEALSRHIFSAPTPSYKTGIAFLSWLNGHQSAFAMVGGMHAARSLVHLATLVALADDAGALERPELAEERWNQLLRLNGLS